MINDGSVTVDQLREGDVAMMKGRRGYFVVDGFNRTLPQDKLRIYRLWIIENGQTTYITLDGTEEFLLKADTVELAPKTTPHVMSNSEIIAYYYLKTSPKMQKLITDLMDKHHVNLLASESHLSLEVEGYMRLVIEKVTKHCISVAHYYSQNGDAMRDPEIVFWINPKATNPDDCWYPTVYQQDGLGIYQELIKFENGSPKTFRKTAQKDAARFADTWAKNLIAQGFKGEAVQAKSLNRGYPDEPASTLTVFPDTQA